MTVKLIKTDQQFMAFLGSDKLVVAYFSLPWCKPCKFISPIFRKLSKIFINAEFLKINGTECRELVSSNHVLGYPTFIFFEDKKPIECFLGADRCRLFTNILKHYGQFGINLVDKATSGECSQAKEELDLEPEDESDALLGSNVYFYANMKKFCAEIKRKEKIDKANTSDKDKIDQEKIDKPEILKK